MDENETVIAKWVVGKEQVVFPAILITFLVFFLFVFSFVSTYFVTQSTNIVLLVVPLLFFFLLLAVLPELLKSLKSIPEGAEVVLTPKGVYRNLANSESNKFIPWEQMSGFDMLYLSSNSLLGKLFIRPTKFFLKSKYEEDNFVIDAFGEDVDTLRAYLKENNVPFGFLKKA